VLGVYFVSPTSPYLGGNRSGKRRGGYGEVKLGGKLMKYAIVEDGGKQYKAVEGGTIDVDHFGAEIGEQLDLERVLLVAEDDHVTVGTPLVQGVKVQATVVDQIKGKKIIVFKYKPKKRYRVKSGHRQQYTRLKIDSIAVE
jgi:large subunit ribosomal protein L21